jgi:hypothetical protein
VDTVGKAKDCFFLFPIEMAARERVILVFVAFFVGLTVCRKKDANDDRTMLNSALERAPALCHAKLRQIACTSESTACKYLYYGTCMAPCARKFYFQRLRSYTLGVPQGRVGAASAVYFGGRQKRRGNTARLHASSHCKAVVQRAGFGGNKTSHILIFQANVMNCAFFLTMC